LNANDSDAQLHYNPLFVTILPRERRSRHAYQLCIMAALITVSLSQLILGAIPGASIRGLNDPVQVMLNWFCLIGGFAGILAAFIPERIVRWSMGFRRFRINADFDATYFRLWEEFGSHVLIATVWASYFITITMSVGIVHGLTIGTGLALWLIVAALWRAGQIGRTLHRARTFSHVPSAIVGADQITRPVTDG
jgi:hypothetical protein